MKKTAKILIAMLAVLVMLVPALASAAEPTPWSDTSMKIFVLEDFDGMSGAASPSYCNTILDSSFVDGQLVISSNSGWTGNVQYDTGNNRNAMSSGAGAVGFGMYIKNTTSAPIGFVGHWYGYFEADRTETEYFDQLGGTVFYTVDMNGGVTERTSNGDGMVVLGDEDGIPAGFEGYILFPFASLRGLWHGTEGSRIDPSITNLIGLRIGEIAPEEGKGLIIDNIFVYGTSEMESNDILKVETEDTADLSVIGYAAACISGLGALLVSKKKR